MTTFKQDKMVLDKLYSSQTSKILFELRVFIFVRNYGRNVSFEGFSHVHEIFSTGFAEMSEVQYAMGDLVTGNSDDF